MPHAITIAEKTTGARSIAAPSLAVIGLIATATSSGDAAAKAALDAAFPLNTPVLIAGNVDAAAGNAGNGGTLGPALRAIGDQASPIVVVVRVEEGADEDATDTNVIGATDGNTYTGLQALLVAETVVGVKPRILGAPGLDSAAVVAQMVIAAQKLRAMAYATAIGDDIAAATTYRDTFTARELMLIWPDTSASDTFAGDIVARALGLRAKIDEQQGWHKTISNVALQGVLGMDRDVAFDLLDPSTEAGVLNNKQVTTIVRTQGFRLWGNRTCASLQNQPEFSFESAVRTSHALQDIIASVVAPFMDQPMTTALIKDLLETGNAAFRQLAIEGRIIGAKMFFDADANSATELQAGRPKFRIEFTPAAPMENPTIDLVITDYFYTGFADLLN